jgi:hypothetical protein
VNQFFETWLKKGRLPTQNGIHLVFVAINADYAMS